MPNPDSARRRYLRHLALGSTTALTSTTGCLKHVTGPSTTTSVSTDPIPIGSILPITGDLKDYGPNMEHATKLAVRHINNAGGPLNRELQLYSRDSATTADIALSKYHELVETHDIVGFVGAASSGVSLPLAEHTAQDQVMQVSNASTTPRLADTGYNAGIKYFGRTAPNDGQQAVVMGQILNDDQYIGADSAAFLYINNTYGKALAEQASDAFNGTTTDLVKYKKDTTDYTATLETLFAGNPDAIGFIGYPGNGRDILKQWADSPYSADWVLSEGLNSSDFFTDLSEITDGMYLASPNPATTEGNLRFKNAFERETLLYSPNAYDAVFLQALAMHKAGEASGKAIATTIQSISRDGTPVTVNEFEKAKRLINSGEPINYQGASGVLNLNTKLEPLTKYEILEITNGSTTTKETLPRTFFTNKL